MFQWVKDLALSLLWCEFDPWLGKFHMPWVRQKKKKRKKERNEMKRKKGRKKEIRFLLF